MDYQKLRVRLSAGVAVVFIVIVFVVAISIGVSKQEKVECITWQNQAKEYPNYYITHWQDQQCRSIGIIINTEVK